jgi:hypothetical protein
VENPKTNDFLTVLPVYHLALKTIATLKGMAGPFFRLKWGSCFGVMLFKILWKLIILE